MEQLPPRIRLIAIDIDGTLLTPQREITARTKAAIKAAQEQGIIVTLATARRYYNTKPIADELGLAIPLILCDGGMTVQHPTGSLLHTHTLPAEIGQQAIDIMLRYEVQPVSQTLNAMREETRTGPAKYDNQWVAAYFASFPSQLIRLPFHQLCTGQADPLRVVAFTSEERAHAMAPEIANLPCSWNITWSGSYQSAEVAVMPQGCTKASGVATLAHSLDIPLENVMAIGDNNNDIEMVEAVGWGVAMGHAVPGLKAVACALTTSNSEEGVALAIERYALFPERTADSNSFKRATCL
jgi:Cof subfamily protein (haloacid dehalogenase superfamily)